MTKQFLVSNKYKSKAFDSRVKFLILHYTERDFDVSLDILLNDLSAHYLIDENAQIFNLVDEKDRAWHAGVSFWKNRNNLNDSSIGIEIVNLNGNSNLYPEKQIQAIISLCQQIISCHNILPNNVLAHSDIAPQRKIDPGILFPWKELYENGVGAMPDSNLVEELRSEIQIPSAIQLQQDLAKYGYEIDPTGEFDLQTQKVLDAFRRHFCPNLLGKEIDKESYAILLALFRKYIK